MKEMDWFKKHVDTVVVLTGILGAIIWMNGRFSELSKDVAEINKEVAVIKTVMIMRGIMPVELAAQKEEGK